MTGVSRVAARPINLFHASSRRDLPMKRVMAPHLILFVAGLTSAWAMLSIIGGERERVLQNAELLRRAAEAESALRGATNPKAADASASQPKPAPSTPTVSQVTR